MKEILHRARFSIVSQEKLGWKLSPVLALFKIYAFEVKADEE